MAFKNGITLSPKHGVNPMLTTCFFCGEASGVALLGRLKGDEEAPRQACIDKEPCQKCKDMMKQGVILISVRDGESGENPFRTGGWVVVKNMFIERVFNPPELVADVLKKRVAFIPDEAWNLIGLPRGGK